MTMTFKITRRDPTGAASIPWRVQGLDLHSPAMADDFQGGVFPSGMAAFADGEREKTVAVQFADTAVAGRGFGLCIPAPPAGTRLFVPTVDGYRDSGGAFLVGRPGFWCGLSKVPAAGGG